MRPSRILVGEVRAAECLDLLLALNSGLPGMCTLHANSAREALVKMCTLPLLAGDNISARFVVPRSDSSLLRTLDSRATRKTRSCGWVSAQAVPRLGRCHQQAKRERVRDGIRGWRAEEGSVVDAEVAVTQQAQRPAPGGVPQSWCLSAPAAPR